MPAGGVGSYPLSDQMNQRYLLLLFDTSNKAHQRPLGLLQVMYKILSLEISTLLTKLAETGKQFINTRSLLFSTLDKHTEYSKRSPDLVRNPGQKFDVT